MKTANYEKINPIRSVMRYMPGEYMTYNLLTMGHNYDPAEVIAIHFVAEKPVKANFEFALDGVLQDYIIEVDISNPFAHIVITIPCKQTSYFALKRKETDDNMPIYIAHIDSPQIAA